MAKRKYYTLCTRDDGVWSPQHGSYDKSDCEYELDEYYHKGEYTKKALKIIATGGRQKDIVEGVAKLNAPKG